MSLLAQELEEKNKVLHYIVDLKMNDIIEFHNIQMDYKLGL